MNKPLFKNLLIVLMATITAFSVFRYGASLKEKYDLYQVLDQVKEELVVIEEEKQNLLQDLEKGKELQQQLTQENLGLKDNIKATRRRLTRLFMEQREKEQVYQDLSYRFSISQAENVALGEEKDQLNLKLSQASLENEVLKTKLSSVAELKKAIRELKRRKRPQPVQRFEPLKPKVVTEKTLEGNRGFLTKNGASTYPYKIRIEVKPAFSVQ
jgi:chromosome segregation ATPase